MISQLFSHLLSVLHNSTNFRYSVTFFFTLRGRKGKYPRKKYYGVSYRQSDYRPEAGRTFWAERAMLGFEAGYPEGVC